MTTRANTGKAFTAGSSPILRNSRRRRPKWSAFLISLAVLAMASHVILQNQFHRHQDTLPPRQFTLDSRLIPPRKLSTQSDGTFNQVHLIYKKSPLHSTVHCVGGNHQPDSWISQSCHFRNLCFDTQTNDMAVIRSPVERKLEELQSETMWRSTNLNTSVALGGLNLRWEDPGYDKGIDKVRWFPRIMSPSELEDSGYYELPEPVVWIPFHSLAGHNPGHLLWDDFLPIFNLLQIFDLLGHPHLLLRMEMGRKAHLYGTCDKRKLYHQKCADNFSHFLPLLGVDPQTFSTSLEYETTATKSRFICAKQGVAGIGMLNDHGRKDHGWIPPNEKVNRVFNVGKGPLLYDFRNYLMANMKIPESVLQAPFQFTFSTHSSGYEHRNTGFEAHIQGVSKEFPQHLLRVKAFEMHNLSVAEQMRIASQSSLFATACGGGAVTATFLPRGSSLFLFYDEVGGKVSKYNFTNTPAYLDWDLFNNAAYLHVHWFPIRSKDQQLDVFLELARMELERLKDEFSETQSSVVGRS